MEHSTLARAPVGKYRAMVILNVVCWCVISCAAFLDGWDLLEYWKDPTRFPLGSEVAGLRYQCTANFLGITVGSLVIYLFGLLLPLRVRDQGRKAAIRLAVALWAVWATLSFLVTSE